jgi:hypothetical protein
MGCEESGVRRSGVGEQVVERFDNGGQDEDVVDGIDGDKRFEGVWGDSAKGLAVKDVDVVADG